MTDTNAGTTLLDIVDGRRGHFKLESGHHSSLWLDLDALFANPRQVAPLVNALANALRPHDVSVVCGPLLGGAFLAQLVAHALDLRFCFTERMLPTDNSGLYPARYQLPSAFARSITGKRVAMVDDVMSAGSALRGTFLELQDCSAKPAVAGALLVLGKTGLDFFAKQSVPVEAVAKEDYDLWLPAECPHCQAGVKLEDVAA
ncbi:MAG TPA: hypothetical protein VNO50_19465 [Pyrinomonadaceae bacterium]|nr:hypothetical protein [Pyrinomonadaceae bacterium]